MPHISHIVLQYGFENVHAAHDQLESGRGDAADDGNSRVCGGAERQISQRDFWAGGLMKVHLEHVQEDIFAIKERILGNSWEILRGGRARNCSSDFVVLGSNEDITILKLKSWLFLPLYKPI